MVVSTTSFAAGSGSSSSKYSSLVAQRMLLERRQFRPTMELLLLKQQSQKQREELLCFLQQRQQQSLLTAAAAAAPPQQQHLPDFVVPRYASPGRKGFLTTTMPEMMMTASSSGGVKMQEHHQLKKSKGAAAAAGGAALGQLAAIATEIGDARKRKLSTTRLNDSELQELPGTALLPASDDRVTMGLLKNLAQDAVQTSVMLAETVQRRLVLHKEQDAKKRSSGEATSVQPPPLKKRKMVKSTDLNKATKGSANKKDSAITSFLRRSRVEAAQSQVLKLMGAKGLVTARSSSSMSGRPTSSINNKAQGLAQTGHSDDDAATQKAPLVAARLVTKRDSDGGARSPDASFFREATHHQVGMALPRSAVQAAPLSLMGLAAGTGGGVCRRDQLAKQAVLLRLHEQQLERELLLRQHMQLETGAGASVRDLLIRQKLLASAAAARPFCSVGALSSSLVTASGPIPKKLPESSSSSAAAAQMLQIQRLGTRMALAGTAQP